MIVREDFQDSFENGRPEEVGHVFLSSRAHFSTEWNVLDIMIIPQRGHGDCSLMCDATKRPISLAAAILR